MVVIPRARSSSKLASRTVVISGPYLPGVFARSASSTDARRAGAAVQWRSVRSHRTLLVVVLAGALAACGGGAVSKATRASEPNPCGTRALSATKYTHVLWVWMENHSYEEIIGSSEAPYINSLAGQCGLATNYHNISHPSLPNYVGATSGLPLAALGRFSSDCRPGRRCSSSATSIFGQVPSWRAYQESMPKHCYRRNKREYAVRHNPPPYYTTLGECAVKDVPYTQLALDLASRSLPAFAFVTPNLIDDMHDGTIAQGDAWLKANLPAILGSSEYQSGALVVFLTWDEGEGGIHNECATNTSDAGCHVATLVISPSTVPATQSSLLLNHYSLLRDTEQLLGVPALGEAATANSMLSAFNL
jgi:phosphatidylinositol-3-phosphatase